MQLLKNKNGDGGDGGCPTPSPGFSLYHSVMPCLHPWPLFREDGPCHGRCHQYLHFPSLCQEAPMCSGFHFSLTCHKAANWLSSAPSLELAPSFVTGRGFSRCFPGTLECIFFSFPRVQWIGFRGSEVMASGNRWRSGQQDEHQGECSGFREKSHSSPWGSSSENVGGTVASFPEPLALCL